MAGVHLDRRWQMGGKGGPGSPHLAPASDGGSCLPKDVDALRTFASERRVPTVSRCRRERDRARPGRVTAILDGALGGLRDKTVAVFGLAFKPGTDLRDSPALALIRAARRGCRRAWLGPMIAPSTASP
jgi:UDP-glucose 6-dehydrogenase